jgi:hypothetical protein
LRCLPSGLIGGHVVKELGRYVLLHHYILVGPLTFVNILQLSVRVGLSALAIAEEQPLTLDDATVLAGIMLVWGA